MEVMAATILSLKMEIILEYSKKKKTNNDRKIMQLLKRQLDLTYNLNL